MIHPDGVAVLCVDDRWLALGLHAGPLILLSPDGEELQRLVGHAGGTLAVVPVRESDASTLVSAGADGHVRTWAVGSSGTACSPPLESGIRGAHGTLVDSLAVGAGLWAAAAGRCIAVGMLSGTGSVASVGPQPHAIDGLAFCGSQQPGGTTYLAASSFGGVTLWRQCGDVPEGDGEEEEATAAARAPRFERLRSLPACQPSEAATLSFDGWSRELVAAPSGGWLACAASLSVDEPQHVRLWRVSDGADFVCDGHEGRVRALCWSADSRMMASCSGATASVWRFRPGGSSPAGTPPLRLRGSGATLTAASFSPCGTLLVVGASDGTLASFALPGQESAAVPAGEVEARVWQPAGVEDGDEVEQLGWVRSSGLVVACFASGLVVCGGAGAVTDRARLQ